MESQVCKRLPEQVSSILQAISVKEIYLKVVSGGNSTFVFTENAILAAGDNLCGQLGLEKSGIEGYVTKFTPVECLLNKVGFGSLSKSMD